MGKGNRNREMRITENSVTSNPEVKLSRKQLIKQQEKKARIKKHITIITSIVIVIALVVAILVISLNKAPKLEATVSATSEKYSINNSMMAYFLYSQYQSYVNEYSSYLSYIGLDTSKSLKSQTMSDGNSWFAYFMNAAKSQVNEYVALASEALEKGYKLESDDLKDIDEYMTNLKTYATSNGYSSLDQYLAKLYVTGVTASAVRSCLELQQLAAKYYSDIMDSYEYEEAEIAKFVEDNPEEFYKFDYLWYSFKPTYPTDATDAQKTQALADAKAEAEDFLSKAGNEKDFKNLINEIEAAKAAAEAESAESGTGSGSDTEKDYAKDYVKEGGSYSKDDDFSVWAFETERKAGDTKIIETKDSNDKVTGYTVYLLRTTAYKDDYKTKDVMHILFTTTTYSTKENAKQKAEEILAEFKKGDMTKEAFAELAKKYSEDTGSVEDGGLYEEVLKDYMVTEFNDWIYDEDRKANDLGIVETTYGAHIMFFVGDGREAWKVNSESGLKSEEYTKDVAALKEKFAVTYDNEKLTLIP